MGLLNGVTGKSEKVTVQVKGGKLPDKNSNAYRLGQLSTFNIGRVDKDGKIYDKTGKKVGLLALDNTIILYKGNKDVYMYDHDTDGKYDCVVVQQTNGKKTVSDIYTSAKDDEVYREHTIFENNGLFGSSVERIEHSQNGF